jgi:hypothetical protein
MFLGTVFENVVYLDDEGPRPGWAGLNLLFQHGLDASIVSNPSEPEFLQRSLPSDVRTASNDFCKTQEIVLRGANRNLEDLKYWIDREYNEKETHQLWETTDKYWIEQYKCLRALHADLRIAVSDADYASWRQQLNDYSRTRKGDIYTGPGKARPGSRPE